MTLTAESFAALVDHTILKPEATSKDIDRICEEALSLETASVCVNPLWVPQVSDKLSKSKVLTCTVVGFPLGCSNVKGLEAETKQAVSDGAQEVDMVLPFGALKGGDDSLCQDAIKAVRESASDSVLKVIIESAALTDDEIKRACELSLEGGADFVKTSTGFHSSGGASVHAVSLMKKTVGDNAKVKASGGIRSLEDVKAMIEAGADRLGMSATIPVFESLKAV